MKGLFTKKPLSKLVLDSGDGINSLKRTLTAGNLVALGVGAIIGAGLFVRTAAAAANNAGPSVTIGFIIAGIGCAFAGLCYAEFASMIPIAGSAYTYSYATMGELVAWIIGWDLVLEYAVGAATVGIAWSEYLNKLLEIFHMHIPEEWCHSPFETFKDAAGMAHHAYMNVPALFIIFMLTLLLIRGTKESAFVNGIIVITKVSIVILFIIFGWHFIVPANHTPYIPSSGTYTNAQGVTQNYSLLQSITHIGTYTDSQGVSHNYGGIWGILGAAGTVFFAFIGFDAVSTAAQEAKNPRKDMPIGILGSLVICTILYILFAHVLTGVASVHDFRTQGREASVTYAIKTYMTGFGWLGDLVTVAILFGFSSVILVMLMGQSRVFYSMSRDGLVPKLFSDLHPKFQTPYKSNWVFLVLVGAFAAFVPGDIVGDMTSIGTLFAFVLVCAGVWIMRVKNPEIPRQFKTPLVPLIPILGILVCVAMMAGLGKLNWERLIGWLIVGLVIYFSYSRKHSKLNNE
jgi:APA family basic amino acid/polyamine antiporter